MADALDLAGAAVVVPSWPDVSRWPTLANRARSCGRDRWESWAREAPRNARPRSSPHERATDRLVTVVHGRHRHLALQQRALADIVPQADIRWVALADDAVALLAPEALVVPCPSTDRGLPVAKARNAGAACALRAGAELLTFLDVDCLPGESLIRCYRLAYQQVGDALLSGPVPICLRRRTTDTHRSAGTSDESAPGPPRPSPWRPGRGISYDLFWCCRLPCPGRRGSESAASARITSDMAARTLISPPRPAG